MKWIKRLFCKHSSSYKVFISSDEKSDVLINVVTIRCKWCDAIITQHLLNEPLYTGKV